jgi:phosphoadenosine phosphosulfate reductase
MDVVDRHGPIADEWLKLAGGTPVPAGSSARVVVTLTRLKNEHNALFATAAGVGVEIDGDAAVEDLLPFLSRLGVIIVRFTAMRDGRPFSIGRLLRERYGFQADMRAAGPFIPDQVLFLLRCGYSTFEVGAGFSIESLKQSVTAYSAWYQRSFDRSPTVVELRRRSGDSASPEQATRSALTRRLELLNKRYEDTRPLSIISAMTEEEFAPGKIALVSSFGTESAVLLHMVARIRPDLPVIFLDTGKLFGETQRYRDDLVSLLGLTDVRSVTPAPEALATHDPKGVLWSQDANACCYWRKTEPLNRALSGFEAWFTGRKAFQAATRAQLPVLELVEDKFKINPLVRWSKTEIDAYFAAYDLPRHPLEADGFLSIGCMPCTSPVAPGENARAGRWRGNDKVECGIHLPIGQPVGAHA